MKGEEIRDCPSRDAKRQSSGQTVGKVRLWREKKNNGEILESSTAVVQEWRSTDGRRRVRPRRLRPSIHDAASQGRWALAPQTLGSHVLMYPAGTVNWNNTTSFVVVVLPFPERLKCTNSHEGFMFSFWQFSSFPLTGCWKFFHVLLFPRHSGSHGWFSQSPFFSTMVMVSLLL